VDPLLLHNKLQTRSGRSKWAGRDPSPLSRESLARPTPFRFLISQQATQNGPKSESYLIIRTFDIAYKRFPKKIGAELMRDSWPQRNRNWVFRGNTWEPYGHYQAPKTQLGAVPCESLERTLDEWKSLLLVKPRFRARTPGRGMGGRANTTKQKTTTNVGSPVLNLTALKLHRKGKGEGD